jgi:predicted transglutaminase-like cysteine proteinase
MSRALALALLPVLGIAGALPASAGTAMPVGHPVVPPAGFLSFCVRYLRECRPSEGQPAPMELTSETRRQLDAVQAQVNAAITPRDDPAHAWDYAVDGYGDCNRFALGKRRALIERGWPRQALSLATAATERGEGHLVLVVHTRQGDLVLDNRLAPVVDWTDLPYRWISLQSAARPATWLSVIASPIATVAANRVTPHAVTTN